MADFNQISTDLIALHSRNWHRVWEPFMSKYDCKDIAEVGVCEGDNFIEMIAHNPRQAVAIDIWKADGVPTHNDGSRSQAELEAQYKLFKSLVKGKDFVETVRDYSDQAVKKYADNHFDFVYIDADHSYEGAYSDIVSWYAKVKPGKFLVGHDYRKKYGVFQAVNQFIREQNLPLIFLPPSTWAVVKPDPITETIDDLTGVRWKKNRYVWEGFMRKHNCQKICEVGIQNGFNFESMIAHKPQLAVGIDPWINDGNPGHNDGLFTQEQLNQQYLSVIERIADKPYVKVYRGYSFDEVRRFENEYFDLIYIDGDHTYEGCLKDIEDWYPKVKKGGYLVGDDFRESRHVSVRFGVIEAVKEFSEKNKLNFYELRNYGWLIFK